MKIAIVGATGLVGQKMLKVLEERKVDADEFMAVASKRSAGKQIPFSGSQLNVITLEEALAQTPDVAIFSAGGSTSKAWAEKFAAKGTFVIDNSSAWRMNDGVPLVVPEINADTISSDTKIIANPNCSTIQMVLALAPLHKAYGIKRLVVSTYQSVTGSGMKGVGQLKSERTGNATEMAYPHPIDLNLIPHGGDFNDDGSTSEEQKLVDETRKILGDENIGVSATVVRVPVFGGHSEAVNVELAKDFVLDDVYTLFENMPGIVVVDDPLTNKYPMPIYSEDKDDVFVGRIRRDVSQPNTLNMWVVSDNLRKGAATNAVQIAEYLINKKLV